MSKHVKLEDIKMDGTVYYIGHGYGGDSGRKEGATVLAIRQPRKSFSGYYSTVVNDGVRIKWVSGGKEEVVNRRDVLCTMDEQIARSKARDEAYVESEKRRLARYKSLSALVQLLAKHGVELPHEKEFMKPIEQYEIYNGITLYAADADALVALLTKLGVK